MRVVSRRQGGKRWSGHSPYPLAAHQVTVFLASRDAVERGCPLHRLPPAFRKLVSTACRREAYQFTIAAESGHCPLEGEKSVMKVNGCRRT